MKSVNEVMTRDVRVASPDESIRDAAAAMAQADIGSLPVGENDRLVGMITDRDIVLRATALGLGPETLVREVMTQDIKFCRDDESVEDVAKQMALLGVRRLPVIDANKRLVGIVSLSNVSEVGDSVATQTLLRGVATPH
ncbi:MAG: CBS domain-containing protein [Rudaea sp.]